MKTGDIETLSVLLTLRCVGHTTWPLTQFFCRILYCWPDQTVKQSVNMPIIWDTMVRKWHHSNFCQWPLLKAYFTCDYDNRSHPMIYVGSKYSPVPSIHWQFRETAAEIRSNTDSYIPYIDMDVPMLHYNIKKWSNMLPYLDICNAMFSTNDWGN